jgi:hypothetical protein
MQKLNLRELKGAPLSIILAIVMAGNRNVSVTWLMAETGYSDKTIRSGLDILRSRQIVTQTGRCRYQLTGENVQLPLYWSETTEPADPSPASSQPTLFELGSGAENFSGKKTGSGKFPESGKIPELEMRVSMLEKRVFELEKRKNSGKDAENFRNLVEIPADFGEFSDDDFKSSSSINTDIEINHHDDDAGESGKIPDKEEIRSLMKQVDDEYCRYEHGYRKYPDYMAADIDNDPELLEELVKIQPDAEVLEFAMTRTASYDSFLEWVKLSQKQAKKKLLDYFGINGRMQCDIVKNDDISLFEIDYHYWNWKLNEQNRPNVTLGTIGSRILKQFDRLTAKTSDPLKFSYLE